MNLRTTERGHGHPFLFTRGQTRTVRGHGDLATQSTLLPHNCFHVPARCFDPARFRQPGDGPESLRHQPELARKRSQTSQKCLASYQLLLKSQGNSLLRPLTLSQNHENYINISLFQNNYQIIDSTNE